MLPRIDRLRSPLFAHPDAYDEYALLNFATRTGRTDEITWPKGAEVSEDNMQRSPGGLGFTLHGQASSTLFCDFCTDLARRHPHTWAKAYAEDVCRNEGAGGRYAIRCSDGSTVVADAVVLATGPQGRRNIPAPFRPFVGMAEVVHTSELFASDCSLAKVLVARTKHLPKETRVLVIGGGLTAAQGALAAARAGFRVVMRSRHPLKVRDYDVQGEWLDRRHTNRKRFEFLNTPLNDRARFIRDAVGGGSLPMA